MLALALTFLRHLHTYKFVSNFPKTDSPEQTWLYLQLRLQAFMTNFRLFLIKFSMYFSSDFRTGKLKYYFKQICNLKQNKKIL
jgi:hypothetical protein